MLAEVRARAEHVAPALERGKRAQVVEGVRRVVGPEPVGQALERGQRRVPVVDEGAQGDLRAQVNGEVGDPRPTHEARERATVGRGEGPESEGCGGGHRINCIQIEQFGVNKVQAMHSLDDHTAPRIRSIDVVPDLAVAGSSPRREVMSSRLIAHLAHVEVLTPKPEASLRVLHATSSAWRSPAATGSPSTCAAGASGRTTASSSPRRRSPASATSAGARGARSDLDTRGRAGRGGAARAIGWFEDSVGHGRAYRYRGPGGQIHELFWDDERYVPPPGWRRRSRTARSATCRAGSRRGRSTT